MLGKRMHGGIWGRRRDEENWLTPIPHPSSPGHPTSIPRGAKAAPCRAPPEPSWVCGAVPAAAPHQAWVTPAHLQSWLGWLSGPRHPRAAPVPHGAGGHAGGVAGCPSPCPAVPAVPAPTFPLLGAKCPGEAGLEAGGGGGRSTQCPMPASLPASLPSSLPAPGGCPQGLAPLCSGPIPPIALAGSGPSAALQMWHIWASPMGSQPFTYGGQVPLAVGTTAPRSWGPWSLNDKGRSPSPVGTASLCP